MSISIAEIRSVWVGLVPRAKMICLVHAEAESGKLTRKGVNQCRKLAEAIGGFKWVSKLYMWYTDTPSRRTLQLIFRKYGVRHGNEAIADLREELRTLPYLPVIFCGSEEAVRNTVVVSTGSPIEALRPLDTFFLGRDDEDRMVIFRKLDCQDAFAHGDFV